MSANTNISEGGKGYSFGPVKCLMVEGGNGDFYPWYPEADRQLDSLSVNKNGIYRASDRGVYGWSRVSVNVATTDRVTGKDPDTGEEKTVTVDPETGELVETVVPVEIRIITPPTFIGPYGDGAYIDFSGLTVAAYDANGDKMQDVPFGELIFPIAVARYDPDASGEYGRATSSLLPTGVYVPIYNSPVCDYELNNPTRNYSHYIGIVGATGGIFKPANNNYQIVFASASSGEISFFQRQLSINYDGNPSIRDDAVPPLDLANNYTHNGKTVYWNYAGLPNNHISQGVHFIPTYDAPIMNDVNRDMVAWTMIYGDTEITGGTQIPVQWQRPGDGATLETSFGIIVTDISPNNNDGN